MNSTPYPFLQGWLEKRKRKQTGFLSNTTKRWFTIEKFGPEQEVALCYYQNPSSPSISGWIFLSDVNYFHEQNEDGRTWIVINHPSRTFWLGSLDTHQHHLWINNLSHYCRMQSPTENSLESSDKRHVLKRNTKAVLEPADPRGDFGNPPSRRSSLQSTSERDYSSELEFMKTITGNKEYSNYETEKKSPTTTYIQHDYDLGFHLRSGGDFNVISVHDDFSNDIDDKASVENTPPNDSQKEQSKFHDSYTLDQNVIIPLSENGDRLHRKYNYGGETMSSRLNRAIRVQERCSTYDDDSLPQKSTEFMNDAGDCSTEMEHVSLSTTVSNDVADSNGIYKTYNRNEIEIADTLTGADDDFHLNSGDECSFAPDNDFLTADWDEESL